MTEVVTGNHGLERFLETASPSSAGDSVIDIQIQSRLGHLNVRGNPNQGGFAAAAESALGQVLPTAPNTLSMGEHRIYWLGPDEWLVLTDLQSIDALKEELELTLVGMHAASNDVSGGQIALRLAGVHVPGMLAKGCTLDLHPRVFATGMCAQSGLAKANVLLGLITQSGQDPVFEIVVRRSFSDYLVRWLRHAAHEFGSTWSVS